MPYCPKCRYEYREGFTKCADCGVDLVDQLQEEPEHAKKQEVVDDEGLVPVFSTNNPAEIEIVRNILEGAGIRTAEKYRTNVWIRPYSIGAMNPLDEVVILVLESQVEKALKVIEEAKWEA